MVALSKESTLLGYREDWDFLSHAERKEIWDKLTSHEIMDELIACASSPRYFVNTYCHIYDAERRDWIAFILWAAQVDVLNIVHENQLSVALKPRQVGITWLLLAYALWTMIFAPIATVLIFSRRDEEAIYLLSEDRLRGMYWHLPDWMKPRAVEIDSAKTWKLSNGSTARAFPTTAGDSYTATLAIVDEADLTPNLNNMMRAVKPTIQAGGKMALISRVDKNTPGSSFKKIYQGAKEGKNGWAGIFLPWYAHPGRDKAWYDTVLADVIERTGSDDEMKEQYPETDIEALEPPQLNKRIPPAWLTDRWKELDIISLKELPDAPALTNLIVYKPPDKGAEYVIGMDCAEGLVSSDDSTSQVINKKTGEQVAVLVGKITPKDHAADTYKIAKYYNNARVMIENNNHGHAAILWFEMQDHLDLLLEGHDGKTGWSSSTLGKTLLYDGMAEAAKSEEITIHHNPTLTQLQSIEKTTLRAPEGDEFFDDLADAFALAVVARRAKPVKSSVSKVKTTGLYNRKKDRSTARTRY